MARLRGTFKRAELQELADKCNQKRDYYRRQSDEYREKDNTQMAEYCNGASWTWLDAKNLINKLLG